jgi:phosphogluconate dehydratase
MELSLFSRDVIAHGRRRGAVAQHLRRGGVPGRLRQDRAGPCDRRGQFRPSSGGVPARRPDAVGLPNDEKARVRQRFAAGEVGRDELMAAEMASYHGPGTCTFYGTANTNQMLMEFMGLHLPGASFRQPRHRRCAMRSPGRAPGGRWTSPRLATSYRRSADILDEKRLRQRHRRADGHGRLDQSGDPSGGDGPRRRGDPRATGFRRHLGEVTPLMARVYPNGLADVNHFHAAGGLAWVIGELLGAGLVHPIPNRRGGRAGAYTEEPKLQGRHAGLGGWPGTARTTASCAPWRDDPFQPTGGLVRLDGNLGEAVMKTSAVKPEHHVIDRPGARLSRSGRGQGGVPRRRSSTAIASSSSASRGRAPTACRNCMA